MNDFIIKHQLSSCDFGEVFLAIDKTSGKEVALKQLNKALIKDLKLIDIVFHERNILLLAKQHDIKFIVHLHASFQTEHMLYLAMDYCSGGHLGELLEVIYTLDENEARLWFAEMILAVNSLHELNYIHRDLKVENFFIDSRGHIKLGDFGFPNQFRSPEILDAQKASDPSYSVDVDWWYLGCIFYTSLLGTPPFSAETSEIVFKSIINWEQLSAKVLGQYADLLSKECYSLLSGFLTDPSERLGKDLLKMKALKFFEGLDWDQLDQLKSEYAPIEGDFQSYAYT